MPNTSKPTSGTDRASVAYITKPYKVEGTTQVEHYVMEVSSYMVKNTEVISYHAIGGPYKLHSKAASYAAALNRRQ